MVLRMNVSRQRLALTCLVFAVSGCQCLQPVDEDAGTRADSGVSFTDAGHVDAGGCVRASDCPGPFTPCEDAGCGCGSFKSCIAGQCRAYSADCRANACTQATDCVGDAGPSLSGCRATTSCLYGTCTPDCDVAHSCTAVVDSGMPFEAACVTCGGTTECPRFNACPPLRALQLERSTCHGAETLRAIGPVARLPCSYDLAFADGGLAGLITFTSSSMVIGDLPWLGGRCVGFEAPTGALRYWLSCPSCMASVMPN